MNPTQTTPPGSSPEPALQDRPIAHLRRLREQLLLEGRYPEALPVAQELARREPGRRSYYRLGLCHREMDEHAMALRSYRNALRFKSGPRYLISEIHLHLAHTWLTKGNLKRAAECLCRARLEHGKPLTRHNYHLVKGNLHFQRNEFAAALEEYAKAARIKVDPLRLARTRLNQALNLISLSRLAEAETILKSVVPSLKRGRFAADLGIAETFFAMVHAERGEHRRAIFLFLRLAEKFRELGVPSRHAGLLVDAGYSAAQLGEWSQCREILDRALLVLQETEWPQMRVCAHANYAIACAFQGELDRARQELSNAQKHLVGHRTWIGTLHVLRARTKIASLQGDWSEAIRAALSAERVAIRQNDAQRIVEFRNLRASAEQELHRFRASKSAAQKAIQVEGMIRHCYGQRGTKAATLSRLAGTSLPILIVGEAGSGKVGLAREIHRLSPRRQGPCIVVPCEQLVFPAADLEGHEAGAWSGARASSSGLVSAAEGGTLVLSRVDELSKAEQSVLLRLVEGKTRAVGGIEEKATNIRIVATCVRPDVLLPGLYHRLAGAILKAAPLRERRGEIPRLVQEALQGRRRITADALVEMLNHSWKGNQPELAGIIERLVVKSRQVIGRRLVCDVLADHRFP